MVETWRDSWFEEGSRLIYVMPAGAVDTILPLQIEPAPSQIARVFVGRIELLTPRTTQTVEEALVNGDPSTIDRFGRFLEPIVRRIQAGAGDPSKALHIEQLRWNVQESTGAATCR